MSGMPWIKVFTEILDDVKMLRLSDPQKWRFVQLILLAGECDAEGFIVKGDIAMTVTDIAWRLRIDEGDLQKDLELLKSNHLMEFDQEESAWFVEKFSDRQGRSQAGKRKQWRKRQRKHREELKTQVFERGNGLCEYCGDPITHDTFVIEHILPPFRGGSVSDLENLAASCRSCNALKGDKTPEEAGFKNPRVSDNENVTGDSAIVTGDNKNVISLEKRREEEEKRGEEEKDKDSFSVVACLYEQEIGPLTPMIGEQIKDWSENYPLVWVERAIEIATTQQKRNVGYINGILNNFQKEGFDHHKGIEKSQVVDMEEQRDEDAQKARERLEKGRKEKGTTNE